MTAPDYRSTVFLPRTGFPMKAGLAEAEPRILARWKDEDLGAQVSAARAGRERFILHDGPIYANGDIHVGHAMNRILKDFVVRSRTLMGLDAPFIPGFDCHGLPIEWKVEEAYRKEGRTKDSVPPAEFRLACREFAAKWVAVQTAQFERLGIGGDWAHPYNTMDYASEAAIVAELLKFAEGGQLFRGAKPVMWSAVERTALAEAEVEYADIVSTQIDAAFEIYEAPRDRSLVGAFALIWTTTPWTIPVNQALAYGPSLEYVEITLGVSLTGNGSYAQMGVENPAFRQLNGKRIIVANNPTLIMQLHRRMNSFWEVFEARVHLNSKRVLGGDVFAGAYAFHPVWTRGGFFDSTRGRPFLPGEFVTTDQGTGLVHMAPDHGEEDFELCRANGIDPVFAVEPDGRYRADWAWLGGEGPVINPKFNAPEGPICSDLHKAGALLAASADYRHSYPHSWRSKAKLIYRATPQWFIAIDRPLPPPSAAPTPPPEGGEGHSSPSGGGAPEGGGGGTLRQTALAAIDHTTFIPEKGRNRLRAMVEGRPDWLISRQRAWGVPITLFVHRATGEYLRDASVNARIVAAVEASGADAWLTTDAAELLGPGYDAGDYDRLTDILDVWFDSGSTHAFVTEARLGADKANLYLEGSDQHRGWFQSSLLESCGTRGQAPYKAVLTHGFVLDPDGRKMSKSLGNTTDPLEVMKTSGADILRLWVAQTNYTEDVRIGKEILSGTGDLYRKLRNTLRYLLGALDGWSEAERVGVADMPELERWVLHRLAELDAELRAAVEAYDFAAYVGAIAAFANNDLSAFFFDIRKDSLYCDAPDAVKRRAYRTVLDTLFGALVRWLSPVLVFTCEEAWGTRFPDGGSVHLLEWPQVDAGWRDDGLAARWSMLRGWRAMVTEAIEPLRRDKVLGASLEAQVSIRANAFLLTQPLGGTTVEPILIARAGSSEPASEPYQPDPELLSELFISGSVLLPKDGRPMLQIVPTSHAKCLRCWRHRPEVGTMPDPHLCDRCFAVVNPSKPATPSAPSGHLPRSAGEDEPALSSPVHGGGGGEADGGGLAAHTLAGAR